jgi:hypothetical protein
MDDRVAIDTAVLITVSEPWAFEAETGDQRLTGLVRETRGDDVVIALDAPASFDGKTSVALHASARYEGDRATDVRSRKVTCNFEGRDDAGQALAEVQLIGSLEARHAS